MAEQVSQDVVKDAQSMSTSVPIDDTAKPSKTTSAGNGSPSSQPTTTQDTPSSDKTAAASNSQADNAKASNPDTQNTTIPMVVSEESKGDHKGTEDRKALQVNGDSGSLSASEDRPGSALGVDISGGSDTDTSRDPTDASKGSSGRHERSNSVKKPTSFKSVSVTKNFLAKTAVSSPSGRSDKGTPVSGQTTTSQVTAKPRLVAKSGSGLGNLPRSGLSKLNGAGSGPDASKVWNKNRRTDVPSSTPDSKWTNSSPAAAPPPPQKQFTDEELKQQYGIHMATRLQSDETGKESKWADIDDDEDDWAPETVEWMDGTKTTVPAAPESKPTPSEEAKPLLDKKEEPKPTEPVKTTPPPPSTTPKPAPSLSNKTILKPGAHTQPGMPKTPGLSFKGSDKPSLVAKSAAPVPAKSPWATLPPIEKASPLQVNPPSQLPPARFGQRDPHGFDAFAAGPSPAKEIAADDFSRPWREEQRPNRELYNSRSGRYEPVNEPRRGSFLESGHRQPAVLQRPTPGHSGPAEPSAAFQTSRSGQPEGMSWGRRRNSSNVSGGSGRRMSFGRMPEGSAVAEEVHQAHPPSFGSGDAALPAGRQGLPPSGQDDHTATSSQAAQSPSLPQAQPASPYGSVASSGPNDLPQGGQVGQALQDPVALQQQAMKERIERARLAKQKELEEEARKEAEKRERLRAKLASIPVVEKPKEDAAESSSAPAEGAATLKDKPMVIQSPPKPPMPPADGEVTQYGLMKVHPSHTVKRFTSPRDTQPSDSSHGHKTSPYLGEAKAAARSPAQSSVEPKSLARSSQDSDNQRPMSMSGQSHERQTQSWNRASEGYSGWGSAITGPPPATGNVWGPPQSRDKALGNGTFDNGYNRAAINRQTPAQPPAHGPPVTSTVNIDPSLHSSIVPPGPIAPPKPTAPANQTQSSSQQSSNPLHSHSHTQQSSHSLQPLDSQSFPRTDMVGAPNYRASDARSVPLPQTEASKAGKWGNFVNNRRQFDAAEDQKVDDRRAQLKAKHGGDYVPSYQHDFQQTSESLKAHGPLAQPKPGEQIPGATVGSATQPSRQTPEATAAAAASPPKGFDPNKYGASNYIARKAKAQTANNIQESLGDEESKKSIGRSSFNADKHPSLLERGAREAHRAANAIGDQVNSDEKNIASGNEKPVGGTSPATAASEATTQRSKLPDLPKGFDTTAYGPFDKSGRASSGRQPSPASSSASSRPRLEGGRWVAPDPEHMPNKKWNRYAIDANGNKAFVGNLSAQHPGEYDYIPPPANARYVSPELADSSPATTSNDRQTDLIGEPSNLERTEKTQVNVASVQLPVGAEKAEPPAANIRLPGGTDKHQPSAAPIQPPVGTEKFHAPGYNSQQGHAGPAGRSSRFFPRAEQVQTQHLPTLNPNFYVDSPSPPPETYETHHPAFAGDANHPRVNLPVPKARVKLPPTSSATASQSSAVEMPPRPNTGLKAGSTPIAKTSVWQQRISNLLFAPSAQPVGPKSPSSTQALAVTSASKAPLDVPSRSIAANVVLPSIKSTLFLTDYDEAVQSVIPPEEALLDDREFGSLPRVYLPKGPHRQHELPPPPMPQHRPNSKLYRSVDTTTAEAFNFNSNTESTPQGHVIHVHLPGKEDKPVVMQRPKGRKASTFNTKMGKRSFSQRGSEKDGNGGNTGSSRDASGSKPQQQNRKGSGNFQKEGGSQNSGGRPSGSGNNRSWNRNSSSQGNAWGKPSTPAVVH